MSSPNPNQDPNSNQNPNPDNLSYTNLMLFGTPNAPGPNNSPSIRNPPPMPQYGMYPNPYFQQQPFGTPNPYFQQPFFQTPQQYPQQSEPEQHTSQRSGKQVSQSPNKRPHKKKNDGEKKTCNKRQWSPREEAWLAICWCDTSEDSERGNSQRRGTLWGTVQDKFNNNSHGWVRGADQLSSKWRTINNCCKNFNAIYDSQAKAWESGRDDKMILDLSVAEYYDTYCKNFTMMEAWEVVKNHPKWMAPPSVGGSGLRDEEDDPVDLSADQNELFGPDPLTRPMGRTQARKAARSSGSSDAATSSRTSNTSDKLEDAIENMAKYKAEMLAARKASIEAITRQERLRTAMQGVQFLQLNTADIRDPTDRAAVLRMKRTFRQEFREFYEAEDEDEDENEDQNEDDDE